MLQGGSCQSRLREVAADPAMLATTADGDIESRLDLAQILVERAAKILQSRVVERLQGKRQGARRRSQGFSSAKLTISPRRL
jgi:hypothetical protein